MSGIDPRDPREAALRRLLRDVAIAFQRLQESEEQQRVALRGEALAADVARSSERRFRADEVAYLDVNVSKAALASARAQSREAAALVIEYRERVPAASDIVTQALTSAFHIVKLPRFDGSIRFRKIK